MVTVLQGFQDWLRRIRRGFWAEDLALQRHTVPVGPRNAWSNLAYVLVGLVLWHSGDGGRSTVAGINLIYLGLGSGLYHALKYVWANAFDISGMYAVFGALMGLAPGVGGWLPAAGFAVLLGGGALYYYRNGEQLNVTLFMGVMLGLSAAFLVWRAPWDVVVALAVFGVAYKLWSMDRAVAARLKAGTVTRDQLHWWELWLHAGWHFGTSGALGIMLAAAAR